jgi:hypothetical protein
VKNLGFGGYPQGVQTGGITGSLCDLELFTEVIGGIELLYQVFQKSHSLRLLPRLQEARGRYEGFPPDPQRQAGLPLAEIREEVQVEDS